jgi:hypothetical protein
MNGTPSRSFKGSLLASGTADEGGGPPVSFRLIDARSGLRQSRFIGARAAPQGANMDFNQADAELARHHIREVELRIAELQARISELKAQGRPTAMAEDLLRAFQRSRELLEAHLARVVAAKPN